MTASPPTSPAPPAPPQISVIVLTKNEAHNLEDAVASLVREDVPLEVLIVDGASTDGTPEIARRLARMHENVTLVASRDLPIGPARNLGLEHAQAPIVAFVSADATVAPGWARAMSTAMVDADIVYGRQEHTPKRWSIAATVRGLRYHHFRGASQGAPETYASNVNAAVRRDVFNRLRYVDEGPASALDDILFTHEAKAAGLRIAYTPHGVVRHKDAATLRQEAVKNRREGYGWGILAPQLGLNHPLLAWGLGFAAGLVLLVAFPAAWSLGLLLLVLWAPTLRRVARAGAPHLRRPVALLGATLLSPLFDLWFLLHYLRGLMARRSDLTGRLEPHGTRSP